MEWIAFVKVLLASQGMFLAALLFFAPEGSHRANQWLASLIGTLVLLTVGDVLADSRLVLASPRTAHMFDWLVFLLGPLMWFYVRALIGRAGPASWSFIFHGLPALAALLLTLISYQLLMPPQQMLAQLIEEIGKQRSNVGLLTVLAAAITCGYWLGAALALRRHVHTVRHPHAGDRRNSAGWPFTLLMINLGVWALWIVAFLSRSTRVWLLCSVGFPISVYVAGYLLGLRQPRSLGGAAKALDVSEPLADNNFSNMSIGAKYAKSGLCLERMKRLRAKLDQLMAEEKPFLQNNLTLADLARRLDASPHHLSQLLNDGVGHTFFDYLNALRVEEVKRRLSDPESARRQILELAYASGFNSKAAFNAAFKRHVGVTPSLYRQSLPCAAGRPASFHAPTPDNDAPNRQNQHVLAYRQGR
jgi:AraC-like DNA-binding protein